MASFLARFRSGGDEVDPARHVDKVLRGDRAAAERLVVRLLPVLQRRIAWVVRAHPAARREDVLDHAQDVLLRLFQDDHRVLRSWDPARGASLDTFVALVAERHVRAVLRSGRKSAWREDLTLDLESAGGTTGDGERHMLSKDLLERILDRLEGELTPRSRELFRALFVEELPAEEVAERFGMSSNALYTWTSRLRARVQALAAELGETAVEHR